MAIDQTLLETAAQRGEMTLRFYRWQQPTLSLGYFQRAADRNRHEASLPCQMVRRRTGGGAILHDQELTYSLAIPNSNRWSAENAKLYDLVHQAIIEELQRVGLMASLHADAVAQPGTAAITTNLPSEQPVVSSDAFLCFQRRSDGDVVIDGWKVVGSAQRRQKKSLLQHGSILLTRSEFAPELPGIAELVGSGNVKELPDQKLKHAIVAAVEKNLKVRFVAGQLSEGEQSQVVETERKFLAKEWTESR